MDRHIGKVPSALSKSVSNHRVEAIAEGGGFVEGTLEPGNVGRYRVGALFKGK